MTVAALSLVIALQAPVQPASADDPTLRAAIERFYELQEKEDLEGYLSLWSPNAPQVPTPAQVTFVFDGGDDKFSNLTITKVVSEDNR
ncbi:MAG: hypothetical protein ACRD1U_11810, partial [Vicinamibacterales bacterium]